MARKRLRKSTTSGGEGASPIGFEANLWAATDALRNNVDVAECKRIVAPIAHGDAVHTNRRYDPNPDYASANTAAGA